MKPENSPLLPYQSRVIEEVLSHNITVIEKSRRIGISWVLSWLAVTVAASAPSGGGMDVFYMGYEKEMTRQFIDDCADHAKILLSAAVEVSEELFVDDERPEQSIKAFRIEFASGHKILALPSVARAFRSKQGLVILDEAAFVDDLRAVIKAALALRIWGAKIVILSTHKGDTNPFNSLVEEVRSGRKKYHLMRITFEDAVAQGLYRKIAAKQGIAWTQEGEDAWKAEILDEFGDDADEELHVIPSPSSGTYLPFALLEARTDRNAGVARWQCDAQFALQPEAIRTGECAKWCGEVLLPLLDALDQKTPHVFGEDFGRSGDLTVIWPLAIDAGMKRRTPFTIELRNVPFDQQRQILFFVLDRLPRFRGGKMDARGNGQYLSEVAVQRYGARVEAVMLSESWYRENMPPMKAALEDDSFSLPKDRDTVDDLRSIQIVRGVPRIPDSRTASKTGNRHGDAAVAACMAYAASRADIIEYAFERVPSRPGSLDGKVNPNAWPIEREIEAERLGQREGALGLRGRIF
ncbi:MULTISPECIES: hypothetical protein [unclassified Asaia]|uniref:hypothetical protein n=1 Tax=unclassified Asaia TaxID=2685023 RepID=UPI001F2D4CF9|nr:hypothetical protein [Asaia sp. W19]